MLNNEWAQKLAGRMIRQELEKLPPEAKEAFEKTQVDVVRYPDKLVISIETGGDEGVEKVKTVMLDNLLAPISQTVTLFGCKVNVEQSL